jgi:hypothetical protein
MTAIITYKDMQPITALVWVLRNLEQDPEGDPEYHVM